MNGSESYHSARYIATNLALLGLGKSSSADGDYRASTSSSKCRDSNLTWSDGTTLPLLILVTDFRQQRNAHSAQLDDG